MKQQVNSLKAALICIFQCFTVLLVNAQSPGGIFYHLTSKNGLSSNRANAVIQDREGFYWIATQDGLNRFDGSSCKVFRNIKNDSASLSHNNCIFLLEDDNGDIWVATPRGVNRYIKKTGKFERFYLSHPSFSFDRINTIKGMVKDEMGNVWIASAGLWQYNIYSRQWTRHLNDPGDAASVPAGYLYWLQYDKNNKGLWMSGEGVIFFDITTGKFYHRDNNPEKISLFEMTLTDGAFVLDSAGTIWFNKYPGLQLCNYSTNNKSLRIFPVNNLSGGIYSCSVDAENRIWFNHWLNSTQIYDPVMNKTDTGFLAYSHQQSPLSAIATQLYIDRTGNYWISSAKGVSIYNPRAQAVKYFWLNDNWKTNEGLTNAITCIAEQNENILWVGTGAGLFRYDLSQKKFKALDRLPLSSTYIRCLYLQKDSILWIGGWTELLLFDLRSEKVLKKISLNASPQFITAGNPDQIWVGAWANGLFEFSASGKLTGRLVQGRDSSGSILYNGLNCFANSFKEPGLWIGYNFEYGFFKLNYNNHTVENFKIPTPSLYTNTSNSVNAIAEDGQKNLWLGTHGGGLVYFDRHKNSFTSYSTGDGLKGDYINKILEDADSNIWVTTPNGLSIIVARTHSISNSDLDLAFDNNDFVANGILRKNKKLLFFSGLKIVEIDPVLFLQSAYPSKILVSDFKIFEKETSLPEDGTDIRLSYRQNFFSFEYSLLKPNPETHTQYAYKLNGFDKDWNNVRERRTAYYTNVPPGSYEFQVKATDESGKWVYFSKPVVITISPPFWKTWWFYIISAALIATVVLLIAKNRIRQFKKRQQEQLRLIVATQEKEKKNISAELHDDLGVRLSALKYFVTSLRKYMSPDDAQAKEIFDKTIATIDESVEDVRYLLINLSPKTLNEYGYLVAVEDLVNKLSQLHIINISLKQKGMEKRLHPDVEAGLYRITQELINNTLKHAGAGSIQLNIENTGDSIQLHYADDGKGFNLPAGQAGPDKSAGGYGIENIHTRVALMNGKIEWDAEINKPTKVNIVIPYNHT